MDNTIILIGTFYRGNVGAMSLDSILIFPADEQG
jgi:hypothetical protein